MNATRTKNKNVVPKQDITLMTILANESTSDCRKLLKKYGKQDATDYKDLEVKLAQLYYDAPDKVALEKEMAAIHPHKQWLMKNITPIEIKKEEIKVEPIKVDTKLNETNATCCSCPKCMANKHYIEMNSSFDANVRRERNETVQLKQTSPFDYIGLIATIGVIGLSFYVLSKQIK